MEDFVINPKFFFLLLLQYIKFGIPALRYFAVYVFTTVHFLF